MLHTRADEPNSVINSGTAETDSRFGSEHNSKIIHRPKLTPTQAEAIGRHKRFLDTIRSSAVAAAPKVIHIERGKLPPQIPVVLSPDDWAFGPIVYHAPRDSFPNVKEVSQIVCGYYGIGRSAMITARRDVKYCRPRQVVMYLCHILTPRSYPQIGRGLGNRDHTTILNGVRKIQAVLCARDEKLMADIDALIERIVAVWPECAVRA